jgi:predicted PurR-regulated permease PerM
MIEPVLHIRRNTCSGLLAPVLAIVAIVVIFGVAVWTGTSLLIALLFALLVAMAAGEISSRLEQYGSIDEARGRLDQLEKEGRR